LESDVQGEIVEALSALYDRHFVVKPAITPALLDAAYALRYQVYCVEHHFEAARSEMGDRETDPHDAHSVHAVLWHRHSNDVVGCVRLILPTAQEGLAALPLRSLLGPAERARVDALPAATTAEISRYAVSKSFRRRTGEELYPDVASDLSPGDARRLAPHMTLGLFRGVATLATSHGITHVCAAMAPSLLRLLERFGLSFERLGAPIDYHGLRQPCIAELEVLRRGLLLTRSDYSHFADPTFQPTLDQG